MVAEVSMTGPTDEDGAPMCNGTGETLPLAPGKWQFSAPLASGTVTCVRNIQGDGDLSILLVDGVDGCGGANGGSGMPAEGETPAPADAATPAAG